MTIVLQFGEPEPQGLFRDCLVFTTTTTIITSNTTTYASTNTSTTIWNSRQTNLYYYYYYYYYYLHTATPWKNRIQLIEKHVIVGVKYL